MEGIGCFFTYSPTPCPSFSSCGNFITSVLNSYLQNLTITGFIYDESQFKQYDAVTLKCHGGNLTGKTICFVISDHYSVSLNDRLQNGSIIPWELTMWKVSPSTVDNGLMLKHYWTRNIIELFSEGNGNSFEVIGDVKLKQCLFSLDGKSVGLLFSTYTFISVSVEGRSVEAFIDLMDLIGVRNDLASIPSFDFHPLFHKGYIVFAYNTKCYVTDIFTPQHRCHCVAQIPEENNGIVSHVTYSKDGRLFAMTTTCTDGIVFVFNTKGKYQLLYKLCQEFQLDRINHLSGVVANHSHFSWTSQELLTAYSNGSVRVWQLSRVMSLKEMCRVRCLCLFPRHMVESSSFIPKQLKNYLFFAPLK